MQMEYGIYLGSECVGTAYVTQEGLFYRIRCQCQLTGTVPCRITVSGEAEVDLGICVPMREGIGIETSIPMKRVGKGPLQFCIAPKKRVKTEMFVALSPEEPFGYIQRLKNAYMSRVNGQVGISFIDQSPIQQDSGLNP